MCPSTQRSSKDNLKQDKYIQTLRAVEFYFGGDPSVREGSGPWRSGGIHLVSRGEHESLHLVSEQLQVGGLHLVLGQGGVS